MLHGFARQGRHAALPADRAGRESHAPRVSLAGVWAAIAGLAVVLSATRALRLDVAGLRAHPYLLVIAPSFLFFGLPRLRRFPRAIATGAAGFLSIYVVSLLQGPGTLGETIKILAVAVTVVTVAVSIESRRDYELVVLALAFAAAAISMRAFLGGDAGVVGANPLEEIANKNAFSLYVLGPLLLMGESASRPDTSRLRKWLLAASMIVMIGAIFATGNRSGWLGVTLVGLLLVGRQRSVKAVLLVGVVGVAAYYVLTTFSSTEAFENRVEVTERGYSSDELRRELLLAALKVGVENPLLGVSPLILQRELARRVQSPAEIVDPHNVVGHIVGSSGLIAFGTIVLLLWLLWRRPAHPELDAYHVHTLLRMLTMLWVVRGMFSREVLYAPMFAIPLGALIGLGMAQGMWTRFRPEEPARAPALGARGA